MGGNWPTRGSRPERSDATHCLKVPPPARLQRYRHSATVSSEMPQLSRKRRPESGSSDAGVSVTPGSMVLHVVKEGGSEVAFLPL